MKHILTCSFGKDSIATALLALQYGEPLDELVYSEVMFSDTVSGELPEHKRFIYETAIPYFEKRGIPTRVLRGQKTYLDCFYHIVSRGNAEGKVSEDSYDENRMDILFGELEQRDPHHPAVLQYRSFKLGSAKTLSSIMVTAVSNLHMLQSAAFAEMIATDEMFLPKLGVEKRAIFCVIPDNDDTFNFMVSILYTQLFDQLFRLADSTPEFHGTLPVHVRLMMDEFANVATPENFVKILAVARSRNISCDIILQNISQIKSKYKDDWETIIGNCDSLVYLGGNDYSTFEYISKLLGKQTIRTKGQSIGKGSHGSSSDSYQVTGRELMTPDEVRRMKRSDCLVMISGEAPVRDKKYNLFDHPNLKYTPDYRSPRGLLHRAATPIPAPEGYTMPPDYMAQAGTVSLAYVAELTCPEITEDLYDELQEWEESLL